MRYWLTTHWPHEKGTRGDAPHRGVWVQDGKQSVLSLMKVGDLVWFYESQSGRNVAYERPDGSRKSVGRHRGRGGIVTLGAVKSVPREEPDRDPEIYMDGTSMWWRWHAPTRLKNTAGYVSRRDLNRILGYKDSYGFRGFGTRSSGVKEIFRETHETILSAYLSSIEAEESTLLASGATGPWGGAGGEGPVHRKLKDAIAADPSGLLGEPGMTLVHKEYPFKVTGDRIDVLLRDVNGQYIAVEVEPDCPEDHSAGPLQCVKYRALLAFQLDREVEEVRTMLVAHSVAPKVRNKAERYDVEVREVQL